MGKPTIENAELTWRDGNVPEATQFGDIYYSPEDGLAETDYVFLDGINAPDCWKDKHSFAIGETGFGTGLNFLATWDKWQKTAKSDATFHYVSVEGFPLTAEQLKKALAPFKGLAPLADELINNYPLPYPGFHHITLANGRVKLTLLFGPVEKMLSELSGKFDAWYLDGFAPAKNPEMWSDSVFKELARLLKPTSKIATFTAAGFVKRSLEKIGFETTKTKGFGNKRHRILAEKNQASNNTVAPKTIAIIGAGIAGCTLANSLKKQGLSPTLIDRHDSVGREASGNPIGIIKPQLSKGNDPVVGFNTLSFIHAHCFYQNLCKRNPDIITGDRGTVEWLDDSEIDHFKELTNQLNWPDDILSVTPCNQGTTFNNKWGFALLPKVITAELSKDIPFMCADILSIESQEDKWCLFDMDGEVLTADIIVIANGMAASKLVPNSTIKLSARRGQLHTIPTWDNGPTQTQGIKGYLTPKIPGTDTHVLGASFSVLPDKEIADEASWKPLREDEYKDMLLKCDTVKVGISKNPPPMKGRASIRATTQDHMPVVGPVFADNDLVEARTRKPSGWEKKILDNTAPIPNLYLMTGLGSKGFQTAPLLADYLTSLITDTPSPLEKRIARALNPGRFKLWEMKRKKKKD